jgi:GGDEF domain-containing protein
MDNEKPARKNIIREKSFAFALRIVKLNRYLQEDKREYVLSKQSLRSGTAIGALVREAEQAESKADFIHKLSIALKEAKLTPEATIKKFLTVRREGRRDVRRELAFPHTMREPLNQYRTETWMI